jgi:hypothetical protein
MNSLKGRVFSVLPMALSLEYERALVTLEENRRGCTAPVQVEHNVYLVIPYLESSQDFKMSAAANIAFAVLPTNSLARVQLPAATDSVTPGNITGAYPVSIPGAKTRC